MRKKDQPDGSPLTFIIPVVHGVHIALFTFTVPS